jgi:exodeoxyribonuclease VII small subunit
MDLKEPTPEGADAPSHTLEGRLRRLTDIVETLEADEVELDRALALFEEGIAHVREAERILADAELRVEELVRQAGAAETRPLEPEDE